MALTQLPALTATEPFLNFRRLMVLRGANMWSRRSCLEVWVELGALNEWSSELIPGFNDRYKAWLPTVIEHRCSVGERGGFFTRLDRGTYLAHILEHTTLELETLAGSDAGFGRAREMSEEGVYKVAIRYEEESVGKACLFAARELLKACVYNLPYDVDAEVRRLKDMADRRCLGPSTKAILAAAHQRNIPFTRLTTGSLCVLGQGHKQRRIWTAETDRTSAIAESIAQDKQLTKRLLQSIGVPIPEGRVVSDAEDAVLAAAEIGSAVVVKPRDGNHGRGVIPELTLAEDIRRAFAVAAQEGSGVIVERFVPGDEHRLLVVGDRLIAAAKGEPIVVQADGVRSVEQLITTIVNADPRRGEDESQPLCPIRFNDALQMELSRQELTLQSIPDAGRIVLVKRYDNLSMDVTDSVHPAVAQQVVKAAQMVGLDIAGIDLVASDISRPLEQQQGAIVEVNAGPGLLMHVAPSHGSPQPVGAAIIDLLFPKSETNARIPIITVTSSRGASRVVVLLKEILAAAGEHVGWSSGVGLHLNDTVLDSSTTNSSENTRRLLINPQVTAAVISLNPESVLSEGLEFDRADIAIVTDVDWESQLGGEFDLFDRDKVFALYRSAVDVILPGGTAILNASDPMALEMKPLSQAGVVLYARDASLPSLVEHRQTGHAVATIINDSVQICVGESCTTLLELKGSSASYPEGELDAVLAAGAAAFHLGVPAATVAKALAANLGRLLMSS